ncbi:hypothetical protein VmeM32_00199 [Vibrio phage vB_VmeM-32]|nr:hypothetical protein VmeM32_00199 [Vibrio phage vB_VmeM-32]
MLSYKERIVSFRTRTIENAEELKLHVEDVRNYSNPNELVLYVSFGKIGILTSLVTVDPTLVGYTDTNIEPMDHFQQNYKKYWEAINHG